MGPHRRNELGEGRNDISNSLILLHNIVRAKMHRDDIRRVGPQPAIQLILVGNVDGQEARVALVVTVILVVATVVLGPARADEVDVGPFGRLKLVPELGAPAYNLGYRVAKGHVAERDVLCSGRSDQAEGEGFERNHGYEMREKATENNVGKQCREWSIMASFTFPKLLYSFPKRGHRIQFGAPRQWVIEAKELSLLAISWLGWIDEFICSKHVRVV